MGAAVTRPLTTLARALLLAAAPLALGCGFGFHANGTVARTAPFHAHPDAIAEYKDLGDPELPRIGATSVEVAGTFVPYYPSPSAWIVVAEGFSRGTHWGVLTMNTPAESALAKTFRDALGPAEGAARVRIDGVVTDFEWYELASGKGGRGGRVRGGRVASKLVVTKRDGAVLYEHELVTEGRAKSPEVLLRAHVRDWARDEGFVRALKSGGPE